MVAAYKLDSQSNANSCQFCNSCQNITLASNFNEKLSEQRGAIFCGICVCSRYILEVFYSVLFILKRRSEEKNLQYIFLRCLIVKTALSDLPICQIPVKRWIHFSKSEKSYWLLGILNKKGKCKVSWVQGRKMSWKLHVNYKDLWNAFGLKYCLRDKYLRRFETPWNHMDVEDFRHFIQPLLSTDLYCYWVYPTNLSCLCSTSYYNWADNPLEKSSVTFFCKIRESWSFSVLILRCYRVGSG